MISERRSRQSFEEDCDLCPLRWIRSWSIRIGLRNPGDSWTAVYDFVVVRLPGRAVITFVFYDADYSFIGSERLVGKVLDRAPEFG